MNFWSHTRVRLSGPVAAVHWNDATWRDSTLPDGLGHVALQRHIVDP